jgi:tetratricopeptide (TPR) repeat protein
MAAQAGAQPVFFAVEDIQWADPSTIDFLQHLRRTTGSSRVLTVLTERVDHRLDQKASTATPEQLIDSSLCVDRLSTEAVSALIAHLCAKQSLSKQVVASIEKKSDGVPLFITMSTRMVIEKIEQGVSSQIEIQDDLPIPQSVQDLLMQRLDRVGPARQLAQVCGAIGREFSLELLSAVIDSDVSPVPSDRMNLHLETLLQSGLLVPCAGHTLPHFGFRHALIQDAAYQSMWESDRKALHQCIAHTLETRFAEMSVAQPEVVAHHHLASDNVTQATHWHMLAAKKYRRAAAHQEALFHLGTAKRLTQGLQASDSVHERLLDIELAIAGQLIATKGAGALVVGQSYELALTLSQQTRNKKASLRTQLGLESFHFLRGDFGQAHAYLAQAQQTAKVLNDALTHAQCQWAMAHLLFHQGEVSTALTLMQECIATSRQAATPGHSVQSAEVMCLMYSSFCAWLQGDAQLASTRAQEAVRVAETLQHRLALGQALGMQAMVALVSGQFQAAHRVSERAVTVCESGDHEMWTAHARFIHGCALVELGELARGCAQMDEADALWAGTGAVLTRTFYLAMRAQAQMKQDRLSEAMILLDDAISLIAKYGERYYEPEVLRMKGELLVRIDAPGSSALHEAKIFFERALAVARAREMHGLVPRILTCLDKLPRPQIRYKE